MNDEYERILEEITVMNDEYERILEEITATIARYPGFCPEELKFHFSLCYNISCSVVIRNGHLPHTILERYR